MGGEGWLIELFVTWLRDLSPAAAMAAVTGVLVLCGFGLPVPEDIVLITTGFLASMGKFPVWFGVLMGMAGVLSGDAALFFLGRRYGEHVFELPIVQRFVTDAALAKARERVLDNAKFICFFARFLPGLRTPIYLTAGAMGVPPRTYLFQDGLAAALSVPIWVVGGWWFGSRIEEALLAARQFQGWLFAGVAVAVVVYIVYKRSKSRDAQEMP